MAQASLWRRGSRKRVERIRWTRREIVHAVGLALLMMGFSLWVGLWVATHHFD